LIVKGGEERNRRRMTGWHTRISLLFAVIAPQVAIGCALGARTGFFDKIVLDELGKGGGADCSCHSDQMNQLMINKI